MRKQFTVALCLILCISVLLTPVYGLAIKAGPSAGPDPKKPKPVFLPKINKPSSTPIQSSTPSTGQTSTLLPNGSLLLIGGPGANGPRDSAVVQNPHTGEKFELRSKLNNARAWHSATMLPDGGILILGGIGKNGQTIRAAEIFDSQTQAFTLLPQSKQPSSRAYHTSTLLLNGNVLIVGGVAPDGTPAKTQLWNSRTGITTTLSSGPIVDRQKHRATLLPDGTVLLQGGFDALGNTQDSSEIFSPATGAFSWAGNASEPIDTRPPFLSFSLPADSETSVAVDTSVGLLFSKSLRADTVNFETMKLNGREGPVTAKVVPAENGRLVFITPAAPLEYAVNYSVLLADSLDLTNQSLTATAITFTTAEDPNSEQTPESEAPSPDTETWTPNEKNLKGNWRSDYPETHWQKLPPLQAPPGVTALAGQVLTLDGKPLRNVTLQISGSTAQTQTDNTGRFLLQAITSGHQVLKIDGRSASTPAKTYGIFRVGVDIMGGQTDVLGYTIWMPKLDMQHAVTIASPTTRDVSQTTPSIPGLELQLPAGTVIRGVDGETVTQISITPIPVDRPPFPLPSGINVPVFFTIQPGGAQIIPPRARVIYPNYTNEAPGSRIDFWNYDPEDKGWYIYGRGTVTADGKRVVPDPGVVIYEFSGLMINTGDSPPEEGPCDDCEDGDPVDLGTGLFVYRKTDLLLPDVLPVALTRTYRPRDFASRAFGIGATHPFDMFLWSAEQYKEADLILPDGRRVHFDRVSSGSSYADAVFWCKQPGPFYKAEIRWNLSFTDPNKIEIWHLTLVDGTVFVFGENAPLQRIRDSNGNTINISRAGVNSFGSPIGNITRVTSPSGKYIDFTYSGNRVIKAKDNIGREVNYTYDANGRLWKVTDPNQGVTEYTYDTSHRMVTVKDARGIVFLTNEYDTNGRVRKQTLADDTPENNADNPTYQFAYTTDSGGKIIQTDVTNPRGNIRRVTFNNAGYSLTDTYALGKPEQQTYSVERQFETNLVLKQTDALGRNTTFTYDSDGRITSVTELALTPDAITTRYSYDVDYSLIYPTTTTDPLGRITTASYHEDGNFLSVTDPTGRQTTIAYNENGLPTLVTYPSGNVAKFHYETKALVKATDPLGRTTSRQVDNAGRTQSLTNGLGQTVRYEYDSLNQVKKIIDPQGGVSEFSYDPNGNLLTVKDEREKVTTYTYDSLDRLLTRTDPLQSPSSVERYVYDPNGNRIRFTDRRGKVTVYGYDALDRLNFIGFGEIGAGLYESTITYTYDQANRVTNAIDSQSGTITLNYNNLDQLLSVVTPQGTLSYTYDKIGRPQTMTVPGQPVVNYSYDNADRLTSIVQGSATVSYAYDVADRVTTKTLPNGITAEYDYDAASQLTGITYKLGESILGDLTYEYDLAGRRTKIGGSYARINLPQALSSSAYNDANQLTQREATTFTYDANGNLTNDGLNTYTWDARNQLTSISGSITASFQYDALGRRVNKTINGQSTTFLYDGSDVVQEQIGGTASLNRLLGGLDHVLTQTDTSGSRHFLSDALGSTLALTDAAGSETIQYTYEPFGQTSVTGNGNTSQFTGRENDGTGLYYYRARYYSPTLQRFISEDPIEFGGEDLNLYAYTANSPTNFTDSSGKIIDTFFDALFIGSDIYNLATAAPKDRWKYGLMLAADVAAAFVPGVTGAGQGVKALYGGGQAVKYYYAGSKRASQAAMHVDPNWGRNRTVKELHDQGFVLDRPTKSGNGLIYEKQCTGEQIRIMPKPKKKYKKDPPAKHENDYYYRSRSGKDQPWGPHTTIPDKN